jgi:purine-binding chemotaxis protein CheW
MSTAIDAPATQQLVMFSLADEDYGIAITRVQEIIHYEAPRPMPGSAPEVEGVINLRGRLIPVVNLRTRLGIGGVVPEDAKVVITELENTSVGLVVDEVREVMTIDLSATEPPPDGTLVGDLDAIESVAKVGDRILVILDPVRLLALQG